jgi:hypothetical protein
MKPVHMGSATTPHKGYDREGNPRSEGKIFRSAVIAERRQRRWDAKEAEKLSQSGEPKVVTNVKVTQDAGIVPVEGGTGIKDLLSMVDNPSMPESIDRVISILQVIKDVSCMHRL